MHFIKLISIKLVMKTLTFKYYEVCYLQFAVNYCLL